MQAFPCFLRHKPTIMLIRKITLAAIGLGAILSIYGLTRLQFTFDFEQFFPEGDPDWAFFKDFQKDFESDDNFMLIAVERREGVFDSVFLQKFHDFTLRAAELPHIRQSQSLTKLVYPIKTPFSVAAVPVIHLDQPAFFASDRARVMADERFVHNFIASDGNSMVVLLKTKDHLNLGEARQLVPALQKLTKSYGFDDVHFLGRAWFQTEIVSMEVREIMVMSLAAGLLTMLVLWFIFRRVRGVLIAITSIGLGLLFFLGLMSLLGRELNALAALYPILMCIVGTADSIHLMTKYIDELEKGVSRKEAMRTTVKQIGLATFLTCITTAIGFGSLLTNKTLPIREFGINAGVGVIVSFVVIMTFLWAILPFFEAKQLLKVTREYLFWEKFMHWVFDFTGRNSRKIVWSAFALFAFCLVGIARINTDYRIHDNLPRRSKITDDFLFFEKKYSGFRPVEFAVMAQNGHRADDFEVLQNMEKLEQHLRSIPAVRTVNSITDIYKSLNRMYAGNRAEAYHLPDSLADFEEYRDLAARIPAQTADILMSKDGQKARIAARMQDLGRDSIYLILDETRDWIARNTDSSLVKFRATGTGLILDKNSVYIRNNMMQGLIPSVLLVAFLMAFLFKDGRLIMIFLIPNVFPLFFAGALLGFLGIPLEAGISTVFSIVFGIATDDTIHFLSAYKLARGRGESNEEALKSTLLETGKAMCMTSIILFFSFSVMLFSIHPPSTMVGLLVSVTLAGALFCDLMLVPVLVRRWMK
mgnify:CR=1 FL=1